ncbi:MAG: thioredoxin [Prolixibacteraceae bacterium]|nr:thioredoxin [Prolixibacteraceae bacterium]
MRDRFENLIKSSKPVVVDFFTEWCGPCKAMAPVLSSVKDQLRDNVRIIKVDVDRNPFLATRYNVRSVPTIMVFKDGIIQWSGSGVINAGRLIDILREVIVECR